MVENAFKYLDSHQKGQLAVDDLLNLFQSDEHPRVRVRDKESSQVKREFYEGITKRSQRGIIDLEGFKDYYIDVSATLP